MIYTRPSYMPKFVPDSTCVLWLPGQDDPRSATIRDRSGKGNNGTITGTTWARLPSGLWSLRYDGNDYINIDIAVNDLAATIKGTWMSWVKLDDATPAAQSMIIAFGDTDAAEYIFFSISTTGLLRAGLSDASVNVWALNTSAAAISDGIYVHVALVQNGTAPILLVNGVQVAQTFTAEINKTRWFSVCTGLDNGRIGCINYNLGGNTGFLTNGNTALTKLINTNLTVTQVLGIVQQERHLFGR